MSEKPVSSTAPPSRSLLGQVLALCIVIAIFFMFTTAILSWHLWQTRHAVAPPASGPVNCQVYFSPKIGNPDDFGCTDAIVGALADANKRVLVQAYTFTSKPIAQALLDAKKRGVDVRIILDKSQRTEHYSEADFFAHMGIPTFIDPVHAIAHNKVMIIDDYTVITGSFNFTRAAETRNAENLLILHNAELAALYTKNWEFHLSHSDPYAGRE